MTLQQHSPKWFRLVLLVLTTLIVPVIPFLTLGWYLEPRIAIWLDACRQWPGLVGLLGAFSLIADILLPVPSSFVCTTLGQILGILPATAICATGLQIGSWIGWSLGRAWGVRCLERCCGNDAQEIGREAIEKWGGWAIALTRPVPLLAESVVLLLGTHDASFARWFPILMLSNLAIALAWCSLGAWSRSEHMVLLASMISMLVPTSFLLLIQFVYRKNSVS
jgi:membrane protein DedA with SNARE-associated domain